MSRCFLFPPPGYEKKPTTDETDLLNKEKRKEKKHKKDKKDREKKEGKEKREKDRSDGKHREKKDRKEKHRDKRKDKENEKDKEKGQCSTSVEKRAGEQFEGYNGEKLSQKAEPVKGKSCFSDDKKSAVVQFWGQNGEMPIRNSMLAEDTEEAKFVQEFGRRIRDEEKGTGSNHFDEEFTITDRKKDDGINKFAVGGIPMVAESKNNNNNGVESRNMDAQRIRDEASFIGNAMAPNFTGMVEKKIEGKVAPTLDKEIDRRIVEKEKSREREVNDKRRKKRKTKDNDKKSQGKDKDREKEKKKEKTKEKSEHKKLEKDKSKYINKSDPVTAVNNMSSHPSKDRIQIAGIEGNLRKRKEMETNGFSHDNEPRPNKIPRPNSHMLPENGRKLEASQIPGMFLSDRQQGASANNNFKVENKEQKLNGCVTAQSVSVTTKKPSPASANHSPAKLLPVSTIKPSPANANQITVQPLPVPVVSPPKPSSSLAPNQMTTKPLPAIAKQIAVPPDTKHLNKILSVPKMEPPHPDTKYLSQILSVPKMELWSDFDDQEWLFSSKDPPLKRVKEDMDFVRDNEECQVWAEAMHIESVDVFALPYVIPY